jgi:hypothetical protein
MRVFGNVLQLVCQVIEVLVNGLNFDGKTPLRVALENDRGDLAALLREHGGTE